MNQIIKFKLTEQTNFGDSLRIGIPLSKISEIKETSNKDICMINGHEVIGNFDNLTKDINLLFCIKTEQIIEAHNKNNASS